MQVEVTLRGSLKRRLGDLGNPVKLDLPDGCNVGGLVEELRGLSYLPERRAYVAAVNGERSPSDLVLREGDQVHFYPIVSGG